MLHFVIAHKHQVGGHEHADIVEDSGFAAVWNVRDSYTFMVL